MVQFFQHQQQAKRNTTLLVVLFVAAVVFIVALTTIVAGFFLGGITQDPTTQAFQVEPNSLVGIAGFILVVIAVTMLIKWMTLRPGGHVVAEKLGGVRVSPDTQNPVERRVMNVVEEMAIAANMPVPAVYILPDEQGINAFAAGYKTKDAAIGLTRGAVETFSREQLQGVVAHEFSHILNGDMRLNIRLIAILAGILLLAHSGRMLLYSAHFSRGGRDGKNNFLPLLGLALIVIGAIGVLFGNIIKAAVSRQREFLADAAAVQFTRNPNGLSGALKQIGARQDGSKVESKNADENAHLFFGQAISRWFSIMATHPPLATRIKRLEPNWNGEFPEPEKAYIEPDQSAPAGGGDNYDAQSKLAALALPLLLLDQAHSPEQAMPLMRELILAGADGETGNLTPAQQLALVELAVPALRELPKAERESLIGDLAARTATGSLFHWGLYQLLARQLLENGHFNKRLPNQQALAVSLRALADADGKSADAEEAFVAGLQATGVSEQNARASYAKTAVTRDDLAPAFNTLSGWSPEKKEKLINGWVACVQHDHQITDAESKLLLTFSACIEEPLPDEVLSELGR